MRNLGLDAQHVLDGVVAVLFTVLGWIVHGIRASIKELWGSHNALADDVPRTYARRDDMQEAHRRMSAQLKDANDKLDRLIERR